MGAPYYICDSRNYGLFWTIFEVLNRDETKFFFFQLLSNVWILEELYGTTEYSLHKKDKYEEMYTTQRQISSSTRVITSQN